MPFLRPFFLISSFTFGSLITGCAQGGGNLVDSGRQPMVRIDASSMAEMDAGAASGVDAGPSSETDAGPMVGSDAGHDASSDAGPPVGCATGSECDDGLGCNGVEVCIRGVCTAGTPFACDDAISCTTDTCVEGETPSCNFASSDALCPAGQTCTGTGCMAICADAPCSVVSPQCGCPSGQGCYLSGGSRLCTAAGTSAPGATCSGIASCTPGHICINVARSGTATNMCNRFCDTDAECGGGLCLYTLDDGMGGSIPDVTICTNPCDPITQTGCPAPSSCTVLREAGGGTRFFTDCSAPTGAGSQGASCTSQEDCRPGFGCIGTPGECLEWCDGVGFSGLLGGCPSSLFCNGFTTPIRIDGTTYGVCDI